MAMKTRVSVDEFLAMEETKPYLELIDGEVVAKALPNRNHGRLTSRLILRLGQHLEISGEAEIVNEVRHLFRNEERVYLPDINVTLRGRAPEGDEARQRGPVETQPDFAIEVLSPDDRAGRVLEKVDFYLRAGVRLTWVVDPELETVTIYRPGAAPEVRRAPASVDATPVLENFRLELADLFSVLHPEE